MTSQKVTQPVQNPTAHQSKNKRKKNRKKNKKSAANGLAPAVENTMEPNVTSRADDPQKTADLPPIDKESVPPSAMSLPVTSSFLSEISTELDLAFGSNSLIDKIEQDNVFKPNHDLAADVPEKVEESEYGLTEESIKPNLEVQTKVVTMETGNDGNESLIDRQEYMVSTEKASEPQQEMPTMEKGDELAQDLSTTSLQKEGHGQVQEAEEVPILENISINNIDQEEKSKDNAIPMVSPLSDGSEIEGEEKETKEETPRNDDNVISAVVEEESSLFSREQMDQNGGSLLSEGSKNKSSEFPLHANLNDHTSTLDTKENKSCSVLSAINSVIASRSIDTEAIIKQVALNLESEKCDPKCVKEDKLGSRTVVSSNVHAPSIEVCGLMDVQCPEPAVGQRMPSSLKTADIPKIATADHQRKSTFAAALKRRNCIIL